MFVYATKSIRNNQQILINGNKYISQFNCHTNTNYCFNVVFSPLVCIRFLYQTYHTINHNLTPTLALNSQQTHSAQDIRFFPFIFACFNASSALSSQLCPISSSFKTVKPAENVYLNSTLSSPLLRTFSNN